MTTDRRLINPLGGDMSATSFPEAPEPSLDPEIVSYLDVEGERQPKEPLCGVNLG
jgi:hypothetical protein